MFYSLIPKIKVGKWRQLLAKKLSKSLEFNQGFEEIKLVTSEFFIIFTFIEGKSVEKTKIYLKRFVYNIDLY